MVEYFFMLVLSLLANVRILIKYMYILYIGHVNL